jgi:hypothetical protein
MKTWFSVLVLIVNLYSLAVLAQKEKSGQCPELKPDSGKIGWNLSNSALRCRAQCKTKEECAISRDSCGRLMVHHKSYSADVAAAAQKMAQASCDSPFEMGNDLKVDCKRNRCTLEFSNCEAERKKLNNFIKDTADTKCETDNDCTFILAPDESCLRRYPVSKSVNLNRQQLNFNYLKEATITSCGMKSGECNSNEKAFCVAKECVVMLEKPPYKNFVNFEGVKYIPNYNSNTVPIKSPTGSQSKCASDSECVEGFGICHQYAFSINKNRLGDFKSDLKKLEASVACPALPKIELPKSRCFKNLCSFVN